MSATTLPFILESEPGLMEAIANAVAMLSIFEHAQSMRLHVSGVSGSAETHG
jgi:hypothetical protein